MKYSLRHIAAGAVLGAVVAACATVPGATPPATYSPNSAPVTSALVAPNTGIAQPDLLEIPKLAISTHLVGLGLTDDLEHEVPPADKPEVAGWYEGSVKPGDNGPAIILGHINGGGKDGVFVDLPKLVPGDSIIVDGVEFLVTKASWHPKNAFPADEVYSKTPVPTLRLITCGGEFDKNTGHYKDNLIVFAELA